MSSRRIRGAKTAPFAEIFLFVPVSVLRQLGKGPYETNEAAILYRDRRRLGRTASFRFASRQVRSFQRPNHLTAGRRNTAKQRRLESYRLGEVVRGGFIAVRKPRSMSIRELISVRSIQGGTIVLRGD